MSKNKNNNKKISVFFDFANTICFQKKKRETILLEYLKKEFNFKSRYDDLLTIFKIADEKFFFSEIKKNFKKKIFYIKYNKFIQKKLKLNFAKNFPVDYYEHVKNVKNYWIIDKETIKILNLKKKNYNFYLASNFSLYAFKILDKYKIKNIFKKIYISKDIGYEKPNKNFYEFIIKDSKVLPNESYFIGDNYILDYKIPSSFKFKSALISQNSYKKKLTFKKLKNFFEYIEKK